VGKNPPRRAWTSAQSGTGKSGGARWIPVWKARWRGHPEAGWIDKNPRFTGTDHQCLTCGRIYAGPHKGEHPDHMVLGTHAYDPEHARAESDKILAKGYRQQHPAASARQIRAMIRSYRAEHGYKTVYGG
jgi:hypothetical protein